MQHVDNDIRMGVHQHEHDSRCAIVEFFGQARQNG